jgi:tetratricopeptide (TPR) repeat protein
MSMTPEEMEKLISSEIAKYSPARLTDQQYQAQQKQFERDLSQVSDKTAELKKILTGLDDSLLPSALGKPGSEVPRRFETPTQKEQAGEEIAETPFGVPWALDLDKQLDVYDQMKRQLDKLQKELELAWATQQAEKTAEEGEKPAEGQVQEDSQAEKLAEIDLSVARTKSIMGPFETFASFSEDKFNQHMRAAEQFLKQGRYYLAADAYTLASLYKPDDPLAYAGKSHALFASGEYMSSALFLSRALQIFPEYAQFKIDIEAMVGDRDKLESRVVDVEEWLGRSSAPELQFLLAYVYYQMDRPQPAKEAIDAAYEKMPQSPAVLALKKVLDDIPMPPAVDKDSSQRITDGAGPELSR